MMQTTKQPELWTQFENHLMNEAVSKKRITKLRQMFCTVERGLKKPYDKCTRLDIENFVIRLNRNEFVPLKGGQYSGWSKSDMKKFLRQFYKWRKGNNEEYPKQVSWLKARIPKDEQPEEKPILSIEEVNKLANSYSKIEMRMLVLLMFDSGFRFQEMTSVKKKDLTWERFYQDKKCFWIMCNVSKTIKRKIPIPLFSEDIQTFVNSTYYQAKQDDDLLFPMSKTAIYNNLANHSKRLFNKTISSHCLRHSSATYYAKEYDGNMNMIAERYGWSYSSDELKTYIRRSGTYQRQGAKKVFTNEIIEVKEENRELKRQIAELQKQINGFIPQKQRIDTMLERLQAQIEAIAPQG